MRRKLLIRKLSRRGSISHSTITCGGLEYWSTCKSPACTIHEYHDDVSENALIIHNNKQMGTMIFVHTDCSTQHPISSKDQADVWLMPGVPMSSDNRSKVLAQWVEVDCRLQSSANDDGFRFAIRGRGFSDSATGVGGDTFRTMLRGCAGSIKDWDFAAKYDEAVFAQRADPGSRNFGLSFDASWDWQARGLATDGQMNVMACLQSKIRELAGGYEFSCHGR